jgi:hypothetical protein
MELVRGVADQVRGKNFMNNSRALYDQNFANLKRNVTVKLSDLCWIRGRYQLM